MEFRGSFVCLFLLTAVSWCLSAPHNIIEKRDVSTALQSTGFSPFLTPYGIYPGIKPLRPFAIPDVFLKPTLSPFASLFKAKKDEFLNNLFDELTAGTEIPLTNLRSIAGDDDETTDPTSELPTTAAPKIDPSVFITKKFDFLSQLFKTLNTTTTPAPTVPGETPDPLATTIKPTIVPPGFWVPFPVPPKAPKPTKAPKPSKAPKPAKTKDLLLNAVDEAVLKTMLNQVDPSNPLLDGSVTVARKASFLDELLHRVTTPSPVISEEANSIAAEDKSPTAARSLFPPGYWIPPYIYAAKMGIYLDKIFDTINSAADTDAIDEGGQYKRSLVGATSAPDASALILDELTNLKNDLVAAYSAGKTTKPIEPVGKKTPFKKPIWGPKTTPDTLQDKIATLSEVFDKLAEVEKVLLTGEDPTIRPSPSPESTDTATTLEPPTFWDPDPTAVDLPGYYKEKTQEFLSKIFAAKGESTPAPQE